MANVVLVVDMVRGFLEPGHNLYFEGYRKLIPHVQALLDRELAAGSSVLFLSDHHEPNDLEFQVFPVHCVKGTEEPEVIPELAQYLTGSSDSPSNVVPKNRYSGFFNTDLDRRLQELGPDKVIVCGVCTDICVLYTSADARNRDYPVEIPANCVGTFDAGTHQWALEHLQKILGAQVV
jgi:nicotinamidase/pyrazinamidase